MEQLNDFGDRTCINPRQTSNNLIVLPDTDRAILTYEGPAATESDWKQSLPGLQSSNNQMLTHHQQNTECCLRKSTVPPDGQTRQSAAVPSRQNYSQHEPKRFCSIDRPPEASATGETLLLQKCPAQLSSSSFEPQSASCASTTTNASQQSINHMIVQNTNNLSGSWKSNLHNQQQHVKITNIFSKDSKCQGLLTNVGHLALILAHGQTIKLCQRNEENNYQQKCVPQKAIAVVTPLTQQVLVDDTSTKNLTKVKQGGHETKSVTNKGVNQPYILHNLQPTTDKSEAKTLYDNTLQTKSVPSVLATGTSHCVMDNGPAENNTFSSQNERLSPDPLASVFKERKEAVQPFGNNSSATFLSGDNATLMGVHSESTKTYMDPGVDNFSIIPVNKWSLQRLQSLVNDLEEMQKKQQKDIPFDNVFSEILKLYWNGDCNKLCSAAKSSLYVSIIKEVRLHYGKTNSVILHEFPKERQNEIASRFHILEHGIAPPRTEYTSSWLNLGENFHDIDKEGDFLSTLKTMHHKPKIADEEVPVKRMENMQEPTNEKVKASDKTLSGEEERSKPLPPEHQKNSTVKGDKTIRKEPVLMDAKNTCSVKETEKQDSVTVKNVKLKRAQSEEQKIKGKNEAPLLASLSTQPSDVSDCCRKHLPTTDVTPVLDKNGSADCMSVQMNILPPEKARRLSTGEEEVDNKQKDHAGILTDSRDQVTVELFDQDKPHMDTETKSNERSIRIEINQYLETYCCLAKWFHVLGYTYGGLCKCEKKAELSHQTDSAGEYEQEASADKPRYPLNKACKLTKDICVLRDEAKNRLGYRSMTGKISVTSSTDDHMDGIRIVDVVTNYEDVLKIANAMSDQVTEMPLTRCTSQESTTGRRHHTDHKKITPPELKTEDKLINLTLFGTSHLRQKKSISGLTSSDKVQYLPPETIIVRISSDCNEYRNYTKSQTSKQQVWNSWRKAHVPFMMSSKRRQKQKLAKAPESKNYASDNSVIKTPAFDMSTTLRSHEKDLQVQQSEATSKNAFVLASTDKQEATDTNHFKKKSRKKSSIRKEKLRRLKLKKILASLHPIKKWNYTNDGRKPMESYFDLAQATNKSKNKLNTSSGLNFGVLPESFIISESNSSMEANQSANADSGKFFFFFIIIYF